MAPQLITIPSTDRAFHDHVETVLATESSASAGDFERRLRRIYPRVLVRERGLTGEEAAWYVYRDGGWRSDARGPWWDEPGIPRVEVSRDGWIEAANPTALGILAIDSEDREPRHFTDFVVGGALDDAMALFDIVRRGDPVAATILLQPTTGDAIAVDLRVSSDAERIVGVLRLADDIDGAVPATRLEAPARLTYLPRTDVAFRAYGERALARMPEPTPDGLALRLRRLYPHAHVDVAEDGWTAYRDRVTDDAAQPAWWSDDTLPRVRYDAQALILDANDAAIEFFGRPLAGHHWQEFVTPGSTEQVAVMLEILAEVGAAESRFRMPRGDGSLVEFDSYTEVDGEEFTTVFRPAA